MNKESMIEYVLTRIQYYIELAITLCGFDGSGGNQFVGWTVIALSSALVIYTFYVGILRMIDPAEHDGNHIKHRILFDEAESDFIEENRHAH